MKKFIFALVMLFATWSGLAVAEDDPYAAGVYEAKKKAIATLITESTDSATRQTEELFFAMGCHVITNMSIVMQNLHWFLLSEIEPIQERLGEEGISQLRKRLYDGLLQARRDGLAKAGLPDPGSLREVSCLFNFPKVCSYSGPIGNNCAWWHEHPEAVLAMRERWEKLARY